MIWEFKKFGSLKNKALVNLINLGSAIRETNTKSEAYKNKTSVRDHGIGCSYRSAWWGGCIRSLWKRGSDGKRQQVEEIREL